MRKLSIYIIAAGVTLGVSAAQADDFIDTDSTTEVPELMIDPAPVLEDRSGEMAYPSVGDDDIVMYAVDEVVELTEEGGDPAIEVTDTDGQKPDDPIGVDDSEYVDDADATDDTGAVEDTDDSIMYTTTGGIADSRPEGCMECRNLTGESSGEAVEAPAPELMFDVLDGNSTGVDVMDPVETKKRSSH
jgi:hypothetical protein